MKKLFNVFVAVSLLAITAFAQTPTGSLTGTVSSPDGVLPGATVEVKYDLTGRTQTATTNSSGAFSFAQLEPGNYTVTITSTGFKTLIANEVKIDIGREFNMSPILEVGGLQETVTVTSGAEIITSTTGQISTTVSTQQILSFPLLTRNPLDLTASQPGVQTSAYQNTTINGMRTSATNITRDGISINDPFIRANATDFAPGRPSVDDTSEITIITGVQEADQGGGANIQVLTPRGTSDFHGALFAYNRNSYFAANNFFSNRSGIARPFRNRNQFGGKIGGQLPIPNFGDGDNSYWAKDKGFFFFSYEGIRDPLSQRYTRTILTPAARGGAFTFLRAAAGNPINSGGISCPSGAVGSNCTITNVLTFAQNQGFANIPSSVNPIIQSQILDPMPTAGNDTGLGDGVNNTGYGFNRAFDTTRNTYTARVDIDATSKDSINFIYSWNREDVLRPDVDDTGFTASPDVTQYAANLQLTAAYRRIITNNLVNDFRWGRFTNEVPFDRISDTPQYYLSTGLSTTTGAALLGGLITNPVNVFMDQGRNNEVITFADNVNWIVGDHSFRFGGLYQKYKVNSYNDFGIVPHYIIGNTSVDAATNTTFTTNNFPNPGGAANTSIINNTQLGQVNGLLSILGGTVRSVQQAFNMQDIQSGYVPNVRQLAPFINWNHALYAADRWQLRPGLTLNAGVRWELYPALRLDNGLALEAIVDEDDPIGSLLSGNGAFNVVGTNAGKEYRFYKTDYNNFAPSVSIAWSPNFEKGIGNYLFGNQRTVIRAGYSHVYANDQIITALNNTITSAGTGNVGLGRQSLSAIGPTGNTQLNLRVGDFQQIPTPVFTGANRTFLQNSGASQSWFGNAGAIDPNLQIPMIQQYSVGIQRELPWDIAVEARYVGTSSNNLLRSFNLNEIDVVSNGFLADFRRAQANLALTGSTAFCNPQTVVGCQALSLFRSGAIGTGPLVVGTGLTATAFNTQLRNGTVADLAQSFVTLNLNNHPTFANPNLTPFVPFYPNPNSGTITLMMNDASYNYNSLQLELRRRFKDGILMGANYTWSKNLTNGQGTAQALNETYLQLSDKDRDYQRADFDIAHTFNFNGLYQFPFGKGRRWMNNNSWGNYLLGGWDISGILQIRSGVPISFTDTRGTLNRGALSGRQTPNSSLTTAQINDLMGVYEANNRIYWIDPSILCANGTASGGYVHPSNSNANCAGQIFFNVEPGQTGNLPRAFVDGPGYWNANAALMKNFLFTENMKLQVRMEAFNVFNNVNYQNNTQFAGITATTFGQITSAAPSRVVQFAARFEF